MKLIKCLKNGGIDEFDFKILRSTRRRDWYSFFSHKVKKDLDYVRNMEDKAFYATKSFDERISELETINF